MVNYDEWFIREVEKGIAAADRGELVEDGEVMRVRASENDPASTRNEP
jgi:predicted transcriptional regulator